ncbi:Non-centrosomal microtubule array protein 1 [Caenorhabditis elegans]|uniref:Isoform f of Non-centrosomal microtubule array protein 1 n=1 Tax=Caenorhabditis elegans TaxID=6239 RepID=G5EEK3-6|nr:Non-centrosomal microtubule array protein 1 [Caenorhabditis elegans]CAJ80826.1 Non-centrosomal microtubule array protein 1 [Caenorhabditis elegans]|eukprot:NP_001041165.1 Non-centrosomal microtubule array protein 1 [Caenorhabditis elegans]
MLQPPSPRLGKRNIIKNVTVRLRKRGDTSRRDAVEAGFEPRDTVPRCHSTQSLRDVQRVRSYNNSQFQASDLSLNPNGSIRAACDSTSGSVAPTAVVNPARNHVISHRQQHHTSYEKDLIPHHNIDVDRRRSLQALNGSSALYQLNNGGSPNGVRSQFSPSDLSIHTPVHHVGSRVRVSSVNQICDSNSAPQFSIDQRRSVHNIGNPVRNSFVDGIKTTSTPKNQIAVAPLAHKSRHLSESRDEMRGGAERRGSGGQMNLPAYTNYLIRHSGEERLVDGPVTNASDARIAYLEKRIRELELTQKEQSSHSTPSQSRHSSSKSSHFNGSSNLSTSEQLRLQEMSDELANKDRKVTSLESKLLKAYQRIERLNEEYDGKIKNLMYDSERARDDLTRCVDKIQQLENELDETRAAVQNGDHANEQEYHELRDKIWKQERELQESRTLLTRLREKEAEFERMRSEKGYLELKNENLNKKLEAKKRAVEELERSVSTLRLEQTICQQSCSSGSTPLADEMEIMSDIRPSLARPYTKAHSTLGSHNMSPLSHSKSSGLTKSFSNFALNSSKQRDDITANMSRSIREQNRHITMCRAMVVCLKDTVDRMARGENPDVARLLGVKLNVMSESEMEDDEDHEADASQPFSMMSAESALSKQCGKLADLDKDLDTIRCQLADWHGQTNAEGDGDRDVCRVQ